MQMEHSLNALRRRLDGMAIDSTPENLRTPLGDKTVACEAHGDYVSTGTRYLRNREIWTPCPDCEEARMAAQRKAEAEERAKAAQERMEQCVSGALIPRRFIGRTFDAFVADTPEKRHAPPHMRTGKPRKVQERLSYLRTRRIPSPTRWDLP